MIAQKIIPSNCNFSNLLQLLNIVDMSTVKYLDGVLYIDNISQDLLDAAYLTYCATNLVTELQTVKQIAKHAINETANKIRLKYITPNQDDVYREKADQVIEYVAAGYPTDVTTYPFIRAEVNATGLTSQQAADAIIVARQAWMTKMADIEEQRRKGNVLIDSVTTVSDVDAAKDAAIVALNLL